MSQKSGWPVEWESGLERKFCELLEFDPVVISFRAQPVTVQLPPGLIRKKYTPDFGVLRRDGRFIYEVKPKEIASLPEWEELFDAAREHFAARGYRFEVITEAEADRRPLIDNIELLLSHRREPLTESTITRAKDWLLNFGPAPIEQFAAHFGEHGRGVAVAYALLANHHATARIDLALLDLDTHISV